MNIYTSLPKYDLGDISTCIDRLHKFDSFRQMYASEHPLEEIPEAFLVSELRQNVPAPIKTKLEMSIALDTPYAQVLAQAKSYLMQHRPFDVGLLADKYRAKPLFS